MLRFLQIIESRYYNPLLIKILCIFFLGGCAVAKSTFEAYEGPERPYERVAIIKVGEDLSIVRLDGKNVDIIPYGDRGSRYSSVAVDPGKHTLGIILVKSSTRARWPVFITSTTSGGVLLYVDVKAGHTYAARYRISRDPEKVGAFMSKFLYRIWVEDSTGEKVSYSERYLKLH